jgi:ankyrin repeat protein
MKAFLMNLLRAPRLQEHRSILGLLLLVCMVPSLRAQSQRDDIFKASGTGDLDRVKAPLDSGTDINAKSQNGGTALEFAACFGKVQLVRLLLDNGAEINAQDNHGATALHLATEQGQFDVGKGVSLICPSLFPW